jgi:Peptidase inhibitor family I36
MAPDVDTTERQTMRNPLRVFSAAAVVAAFTTFLLASSARAQEGCTGLDCPGVMPASSLAHGMLRSVASPRDLETTKVSGFYEFGLKNPAIRARAVAYVAAPGTLDSAPPEIQALPSAKTVTAAQRKTDTVVIYGPGVIVQSSPVGDRGSATNSRTRSAPNQKPTARASNLEDCPGGWFCLFQLYEFHSYFGKWQDTGDWQLLAKWGWDNRAHSMVNNRSGATLLATGAGGSGNRYCARPNSTDADLSNNSNIDANSESLYNSTAPDYHTGWNCFNPY